MKKLTILFICAWLFGGVITPLVTRAQVPYTVTPRVIDVTASARDIITRTITIQNHHENATTKIFPSVNEIALDEGGDITEFRGPTEVDRTAAITSWLELPRAQINIPAGESQDVTLTIRMNPNTKPGEYHAVLGFGAGRNREVAQAQVKEGRAPTVVVTIRVADTKVERMDLSGFSVEKFVTDADNEAIHYTLSNPGDVEVVPEGEIVLYDGNGKEVASVPANPQKQSLKPGEEVALNARVPTDGLVGQYKAFLNVNYGAAQAGAVYDTVFFYVMPWQKLLTMFGVIVIIALIVTIYLYRKYGINEHDDGSEQLEFRIRETASEAQEHDIHLTKD